MSNPSKIPVLCKFYMHGACRKGDSCPFSHNLKDSPNMVCVFYQRGVCSYGSHCRYDHVKVSSQRRQQAPPENQQPPPANQQRPAENQQPSVVNQQVRQNMPSATQHVPEPLPAGPKLDKQGHEAKEATEATRRSREDAPQGHDRLGTSSTVINPDPVARVEPALATLSLSQGQGTGSLAGGQLPTPGSAASSNTNSNNSSNTNSNSNNTMSAIMSNEAAVWQGWSSFPGANGDPCATTVSWNPATSPWSWQPGMGQAAPTAYQGHFVAGAPAIHASYEGFAGAQFTGAQYTSAQYTGAQYTGAQYSGAQYSSPLVQGAAAHLGPLPFESPETLWRRGSDIQGSEDLYFPAAVLEGLLDAASEGHEADSFHLHSISADASGAAENGSGEPAGKPSSLAELLKGSVEGEAAVCLRTEVKAAGEEPPAATERAPRGQEAALCSAAVMGACDLGAACPRVHGDVCPHCKKACLHPLRPEEAEEHRKTCKRNQSKLEALKKSQEIECSVCLERVLSKAKPFERKFGILSHCDHPHCIGCIRGWRNTTNQGEVTGLDIDNAVRACPVCRVQSHFVTPSVVWYFSHEEKQDLIDGYKRRLSEIDCRHFNFGNGNCPFGTSCFYKHAFRDGRVAEVQLRHLGSADGSTVIAREIRLSDFITQANLRGRR